MISQKKILFTGGGGRLGTEMKKLFPEALYPSSRVFNVTQYRQMEKFIVKRRPKLVIHAAAFTSPPGAEKAPSKALKTNIVGTANVAELCLKFGIKMIYISTDYVFKGDKGNYKEDDPVLPQNKYAWSKLGGECAVRLLPDFLVIRTSLGDKIFPYEKAFTDHFTSRESVDIIARKIARAVKSGISGTIHIGHKTARTVFEYAKALGGEKAIGKTSIRQIDYKIPRDTSLNTGRYRKLFNNNG